MVDVVLVVVVGGFVVVVVGGFVVVVVGAAVVVVVGMVVVELALPDAEILEIVLLPASATR